MHGKGSRPRKGLSLRTVRCCCCCCCWEAHLLWPHLIHHFAVTDNWRAYDTRPPTTTTNTCCVGRSVISLFRLHCSRSEKDRPIDHQRPRAPAPALPTTVIPTRWSVFFPPLRAWYTERLQSLLICRSFTNCVSGNGSAIDRSSVRPFVTIGSFEPTDLFEHEFVCMSYDHSSPGIESQDHRSRSKVCPARMGVVTQ